MEIGNAGVVGAGLMGKDIAGMLANAGYSVVLVDVDPEALEEARGFHESRLEDELREAGISKEPSPAEMITYETDTSALEGADFVVEAVPESLELKRDVVGSLEDVLDEDAVIGTNTSSLTAGEVAEGAERPERVVLFHFANPAIHRDIVEVSGDDASEEALETARRVGKAIEKEPFRLRSEHRANCLSRLSASIKCSATWELLDAEPAAVDTAARNVGFDRGPLELIDLIGLDVHLDTVDNLAVEYGDRYAPPDEVRERMEEMVEDGKLGRKSGEGFFVWEGDRAVVPEPDEPHDLTPVLAALVNEAHRLVGDGVGDEETVNEILKRGGDSEMGPFDVEDTFGGDFLRETLEDRHGETGASVYERVF
jgi:enoyl-CoA hydratase/3-hydroxyacyl-CoA dehydrogenase